MYFSACACVCVSLLAAQKAHLRGLGKGEDSPVTQIQHDTFLDQASWCVCVSVSFGYKQRTQRKLAVTDNASPAS